MTSAITVSGVSKRFRLVHERNATLKAMVMRGMKRVVYEEFWALDDVDFEIPDGKTFALIGQNGSGKSTLLKCMARIYQPDAGSIDIRGKMSALLELGAGFHPELSGRENVYLNGSILGLSRREIDRRFDDIVEFAGLERFIDHPVKNYSSGMFVRLGFSVAINVEPEVLLVDEVLAVGDEIFQRKCMERFANLRREGRTVVVVTHSLETVRNICDEAAWLDGGKLRSVGPVGTVVGDYLEHLDGQRAGPDARHHETNRACVERVVMSLDDIGNTGTALAGAPATFTVHLDRRSPEPIRVSLDIHRTDGIHIAGARLAVPPGTVGREAVQYRVPHMDLRVGDYTVDVTVQDDHSTEQLAKISDAMRFTVAGDVDGAGLVSLGGEWLSAGA